VSVVDIIIALGVDPSKYGKQKIQLRVRKAVELYKRGVSRKILFTGGNTSEMGVEAEYMRKLAIDLGVPAKAIILEKRAMHTVGNAYYCKPILKKLRVKTAVLVTSPQHMPRAAYIFRRLIPEVVFRFERSKRALPFFGSLLLSIVERWKLWQLKRNGIYMDKV
jgi:uncharacterized SAM-binding protein YcdF (DUF218 family)